MPEVEREREMMGYEYVNIVLAKEMAPVDGVPKTYTARSGQASIWSSCNVCSKMASPGFWVPTSSESTETSNNDAIPRPSNTLSSLLSAFERASQQDAADVHVRMDESAVRHVVG